MNERFGQLTISYFDLRVGPKILLSEMDPTSIRDYFEDTVSKLIDLHRSGAFFFHYFQGRLTFNLVFSLYYSGTRGNQYDLMATLLIPDAYDGAILQKYFLKMGMIEEKLRSMVYQLSNERILFDLIEAAQNNSKEYESLYLKARETLIYRFGRSSLNN